jgi:hypothetical protein
VAGRWVVRADVRKAKVRFADSRYSSAHDHQGREAAALQEAVRHLIVREWTTVVVRIPPALAVRDFLHVREWVWDRVDRLRVCRPNRPDAQGRNLAGRDSVINTDLKKVR